MCVHIEKQEVPENTMDLLFTDLAFKKGREAAKIEAPSRTNRKTLITSMLLYNKNLPDTDHDRAQMEVHMGVGQVDQMVDQWVDHLAVVLHLQVDQWDPPMLKV